MTAEQIRSFIAIELPADVKSALTRHQARLKPGDNRQVKWVEPENIHLTLQFLGNIPADIVGKVTTALEQAAVKAHRFHLELAGMGAFPNLQRVQTIWVGLSGDMDNLNRLQKDIGANLTPLGFKPETRPFSPHLTLGRVRDFAKPEERARLGQMLGRLPFEAKFKIDVNAVNLMKSQLTPKGPIYTKLAEAKLK